MHYDIELLDKLLSINTTQFIQDTNYQKLYARLANFCYVTLKSPENKDKSENDKTSLFKRFLPDLNIFGLHDTCKYSDTIFLHLFSNLQPDMSWVKSFDSYLGTLSCCPFYYKSVIEMNVKTLTNQDCDQLSTYLSSVLRYSPGRKFIVGCLSNFYETLLIKAVYNDETKQINFIRQHSPSKVTGPEIMAIYLCLTDEQLGFNQAFFDVLNEKVLFIDKGYLGRGSSSFVFKCKSKQQNELDFILKISRRNCVKETMIIDEMNKKKYHAYNKHSIYNAIKYS
jgi:hypothetical protein